MFQRLILEDHRILKNPEHGFTGDRDRVAYMNLFLKFLNSRCTGSGVPVNTPKPYASPSRIQGEQKRGGETSLYKPI
ncbi:hypothetical protein [Desulfurococcus amylolyticus]|uniref:hypothetical protein n=1 Tax=Desulfurococcus amylolyticus TaxID=94694 RepID=UPI0005B1EFC4|nr:hypothetical protein [Desulfurococcus amylolyticus]